MRQYPMNAARIGNRQHYKEWLIWAGFGYEYIERNMKRYDTCSGLVKRFVKSTIAVSEIKEERREHGRSKLQK